MPLKTNEIELKYTISMKSSFHFGTGLRKGLVHRSVAVGRDGYLYIPGSTIKGSLRNQLYDLQKALSLEGKYPLTDPHSAADDLTEFKNDVDFTRFIFGTRFHPCALFFDDVRLAEKSKSFFDSDDQSKPKYLSKQVETRTQVRLSRLTGTAERDMLFSSQLGLRELYFNGRIYGQLTGVPLDGTSYTYSVVLLVATLNSLSRLGGNKSTGGGEVICTSTELFVGESVAIDQVLESLDDIGYYKIAVQYLLEE